MTETESQSFVDDTAPRLRAEIDRLTRKVATLTSVVAGLGTLAPVPVDR
jgi:hypothetical protein